MNLKTVLFISILIVSALAISASAATIEIASADDFAKIGSEYPLDGDYILTKDIKLSGTWTPIGTRTVPFTGTFDGKSHTISNVKVSNGDRAGFFGYLLGAEIKNLNLKNVDVYGYWAGSLAGAINGSSIYNCHVSDGKVSATKTSGGLIGALAKENQVSYSSVEDLTVIGDSARNIGGLIGEANNLYSIKFCWADADVKGTIIGDKENTGKDTWNYGAGGFVGFAGASSDSMSGDNRIIAECYALGDVSVTFAPKYQNLEAYDAGGFIGAALPGKILRCYSTGDVETDVKSNSNTLDKYNIGGFAGTAYNNVIIDSCFAAGDEVSEGASASEKTTAGSFLGYNDKNQAVLKNNYVIDSIEVNDNAPTDGTAVSLDELKKQEFYSATLKLDIGKESDGKTWFMSSTTFPWLTMPSSSSPSSQPSASTSASSSPSSSPSSPQPTSTPFPILGIVAGIGAVLYTAGRRQ